MARDTLFSSPKPTEAFTFDQQVANVFPDMIRRSVPGYSHVISMLGVIAERYVQAHTKIYDLGSSLGAASLAIRDRVRKEGVTIEAIDNSAAMIERSRSLLTQQDSPIAINLSCSDILTTKFEPCSMVVLNFTLQFIDKEQRQSLLKNICDALVPGGVLVLSEKLLLDEGEQILETLHLDFKRANGYSELEVSQKRAAIENVLVPESLQTHQDRLNAAGFSASHVWFRSCQFASLLGVK